MIATIFVSAIMATYPKASSARRDGHLRPAAPTGRARGAILVFGNHMFSKRSVAGS
jgi:hypothetical protein